MYAQGAQPPLPSDAWKLASYPIAQSMTESTERSLVVDSAQQVSKGDAAMTAMLEAT